MLISSIHPKELPLSPPPMTTTTPTGNNHHHRHHHHPGNRYPNRFQSTRMATRSITHPHHPITTTGKLNSQPQDDDSNPSSKGGMTESDGKLSIGIGSKLGRSVTPSHRQRSPVTSPHKTIQPTPLRQVINLNHLLRENSQPERKSNYPTFHEILSELSWEDNGEEDREDNGDRIPILGTYDIKEAIQSGGHQKRRPPPPKDSPSVLGSKATSLDVIRSTLMDGPYRQVIPTRTQSASSETKIRALGLTEMSSSSSLYPTKKASSYFTSPEASPRISRSVTGVTFCSPKDKTTHRARTISSDPGKLGSRSLGDSYDGSSYDRSHPHRDHQPVSPESRLESPRSGNGKKLPRSPLHSNSNSRGPSYSGGGEELDPSSDVTRRQTRSTSTTRDRHQNNLSPSEDRMGTRYNQKVKRLTPENPDASKERTSRSKPNLKVDTKIDDGRRTEMDPHPRSNTKRGTLSPRSSGESEPVRLSDWRQLDKIAVKLAYHPLTKESKLVYLDDGSAPPPKRRLPKGTLIPAQQLFMARTLSEVTHPSSSNSSPLIPTKSLSRQSRSPHHPFPSSKDHSPSTLDQPDDESRSSRLKKIRGILAKSGSDKIAMLSRVEEGGQYSDVGIPSGGMLRKPESSDVVPTSHPQKLLPVTSAFDRRVRILFGAAVPFHPPPGNPTPVPRSTPAPHKLRSNSSFSLTGSGTMGCTVLRGELDKCNSHHQWQRREFRTDGFVLVCLTKETLPLPSGTTTVAQPDYQTESWHTHFQPTTSPHVTHPLLATPAHDDPAHLGYYQVAKWVIPLDQITHLSLLTRRGVPIPNGFVIHTRSQNYLLRASHQSELATWLYLLRRMVGTIQRYRFTVTPPTPRVVEGERGPGARHRHPSLRSDPDSTPTSPDHPPIRQSRDHHPDPTPALPTQRRIVQGWVETLATLHRLQ